MAQPILLAVPNFSEGRDEATIAAIADAIAGRAGGVAGDDDAAGAGTGIGSDRADASVPVRLLDVHSDRDHHR
jgi:hypothetical protein